MAKIDPSPPFLRFPLPLFITKPSSTACSSPTMANADAEHLFHVLAVDDSLIDRKLIERLLKSSSYHVTAVDSVSKALEFLGLLDEEINAPKIDVNLIITDYCMPGMSGYDLLKKVKGSSFLKDIPVVIMSSENLPSRINRCFELGANEFFLKPVQLSDMKKLRPHILKGKSKDLNNRATTTVGFSFESLMRFLFWLRSIALCKFLSLFSYFSCNC